MHGRPIRALAGVVVTLAMVATACGSDDDGAAAATTSAEGEPAAVEIGAKVVTPGRANWSTGYFQAAVFSTLLEELGYEVADAAGNELAPSEAYRVMAEGGIDFWANGWYSQHLVWHDETLADGSRIGDHLVVVGQQLEDAGFQGLVVTKAVAEARQVASLAQINDDAELAALFDLDGNGKADIFGCPEDWTCDNVIDEMIALNGWANLEQTKLGYAGMVEASLARVEAGEPAIQYTWSPSGYLARFVPGDNVLWLSMGARENLLDGSTETGLDYQQFDAAEFPETCTDDPCWLGWEVEDIRVTANQEWADRHPDAMALFDVVVLDPQDIAAQNALWDAGETTPADLARHAAEWIAANRALVDDWLAVARAAG